MPFQFLRRVGRGDTRLGARRDEEAPTSNKTSKEGSLRVDASSSNQAAAEYFTQYPNQLAKIRLAHMLQYHY